MLKMLRRLLGEDLDLAWLPGARNNLHYPSAPVLRPGSGHGERDLEKGTGNDHRERREPGKGVIMDNSKIMDVLFL
jgi:hypothetical protein